MPALLLAAVHNGELATSPARKVIGELMAGGQVGSVVELSDQPALSIDVDRTALSAWRSQQRDLEQRWREYLGTSRRWSPVVGHAGEALFSVRRRAFGSFAETAWLARQIESLVTAKHLAAWRELAASRAEQLIVLESDATWLPTSRSVIDEMTERAADPPFYGNLAGGLVLADIGVDHLASLSTGALVTMAKPVTNTSCAYLVNRAFVDEILAFVDRQPEVGALGVDWLFNAFFLDAAARDLPIVCVHAIPPALGHGSLTGVTKSWHPDR